MPSAVAKRKTDRVPPKPNIAAALADVTVQQLILDGRPMDTDVIKAVVDISLGRAVDGASSVIVTLSDPDLKLLNSRLFAKAVEMWMDELPFRLADLEVTDEDGSPGLQLEFEPRAVAKLRDHNEPMHASRSDKTRAEFIKALCDKAGVRLVCPRLHQKQPIQSVEDTKTAAQKRQDRHPGIKSLEKVKIKGKLADSEQLQQIDRAMGVGHSLNASTLPLLAMLCAGIGESAFRPVKNAGGSKYAGVFQADPANIPSSDTEAQAHAFLKGGKGFQQGGAIALASAHPDMDPGEIATRVEASGQPGSFYGRYRAEALAILEAFGTTAGDVSSPIREEYAVSYQFRTLPADETQELTDEDYWTCARRLADEVNWRLWEEADAIYYMTDEDIMRSRVELTISPGAQGVYSVTGKVSTRRPDQEVVVECDARRWTAGPATVCELVGYGPPPKSSHTMTLSGRWLVANIERQSLFAQQTTITLHRRQKAKLEPAHEVRTRAGAQDEAVDSSGALLGAAGGLSGGTRDRVVQAARKAAKLSAADPSYYYYSQRGDWKHDLFARDQKGVGPQGLPGGVRHRSDCSTFIIQCYEKAGCLLPAELQGKGFTGTLADQGTPTTQPKPGDICLYGTFPYRHVELYIGDDKTIGHGDARIDFSTPRGPSGFAGYWTFGFLDDDARPAQPSLVNK